MESSIAKFLWRQPACERLPTTKLILGTLNRQEQSIDVCDPSCPTLKIKRATSQAQLVYTMLCKLLSCESYGHHSVHFITHQSFAFY